MVEAPTRMKREMGHHPRLDAHDIPGRRARVHERLATEVLLSDGALGTMLHAKGLPLDEPPELWNLTQPQAVQEVHTAYLAVGCDLIQTNTFGANPVRLKESGLAGQMGAINAAAVRLAQKAGATGHLVAGSIGPTGRFQREMDTGWAREIGSAFEEQISHLIHAGVDLIMIETMAHLGEARMALQAAQACLPVPIAVSVVFFEQGGSLRTLDDASAQEVVRELAGAQVVGCNCMDAEFVVEVLRQMREVTALPLIAQPNAGHPQSRGKERVYPRGPEGLARYVPSLMASKPGILGGCCGTTPAHLEVLVRSIRHS